MYNLRNITIALFFVGSVTFFVYMPALSNGFVDWDDISYVVENQNIRTINLQSLNWMFLNYYASNWHPLTWLSLAIDYAFWGLDPKGYHFINIILHALNTMLVIALAWMLFVRARGTSTRALLFSLLVGLMFGLHPIHVESVAWVSERKDLLYSLFYLSSIIFYLRYKTGKLKIDYIACLLMFVLSLLSKPMAVSLPLVLVILDYYPLAKPGFNRSAFIESIRSKAPMFILAFMLAIVTFVVQQKSGAMESMQIVSLGERLLLAQWALLFYLYKTFIPFGYIYFYPVPPDISLSIPLFSIALAANTMLAYTAYRLRKKMPLVTACALIYLVTLLPVIGVVQVGAQAAADRYMYLTLLVPIVLTISGIMYIGNNFLTRPLSKVILRGIVISVICGLSYLTTMQTLVWRDTEALASHAIKHSHQNNHAYTKRAKIYFREAKYHQAIEDINKAIEISSKNPYRATTTIDWYYALRGESHLKLKMYQNAAHDLSRAIAENGTNPDYYRIRASTYETSGQLTLALADYLKFLDLNPNSPEIYNNAALVEYELGMHEDAIEHLSKAIRLKQEEGIFYFNRALNHNMLGNQDMTVMDLKKAAELGVPRAQEIIENQNTK